MFEQTIPLQHVTTIETQLLKWSGICKRMPMSRCPLISGNAKTWSSGWAQVWLKQTSSSHKLEKLVAQTCPSCHDFRILSTHSSPFITIQHSSWIILDHLGARTLQVATPNSHLPTSSASSPRIPASPWTTVGPQSLELADQWQKCLEKSSEKKKKHPKHWPKHIKHAGICRIFWLFGELINHIKQIHAEWCMPACACSRTHVRKELTRAQSEHKLVRWQVARQRVLKICAVSICFCTVSHNSYKVLHLMSMCSRNQSRPVYASPIQNHWADKRRCWWFHAG